jgi:hypothetical protein
MTSDHRGATMIYVMLREERIWNDLWNVSVILSRRITYYIDELRVSRFEMHSLQMLFAIRQRLLCKLENKWQ